MDRVTIEWTQVGWRDLEQVRDYIAADSQRNAAKFAQRIQKAARGLVRESANPTVIHVLGGVRGLTPPYVLVDWRIEYQCDKSGKLVLLDAKVTNTNLHLAFDEFTIGIPGFKWEVDWSVASSVEPYNCGGGNQGQRGIVIIKMPVYKVSTVSIGIWIISSPGIEYHRSLRGIGSVDRQYFCCCHKE